MNLVQEPFDLQMAAGFAESRVEDEEEKLAFASSTCSSTELPVMAATANLREQRRVGAIPGRLLPSEGLAVSRPRNRVYASGAAGLWEFSLTGSSEPTLTAPAPELPAMTREDAEAAYGRTNPEWQPSTRGRPTYHWTLEIDEASSRIFALCGGREGALDRVVEIDMERRAVKSMFPLPGFSAGINLNLRHGLVVLPALRHGPQILDMTGKRISTLEDVQPGLRQPFFHAAVRPSDGAVLLAAHGQPAPMALWDWKRSTLETITADGGAPAFGPDDTIFLMRGSAELWWIREAGPELLVGATLSDGDPDFRGSPNWVKSPVVSGDGRYVFAELTVASEQRAFHAGLVVDLVARRVEQIPRFHSSGLVWF